MSFGARVADLLNDCDDALVSPDARRRIEGAAAPFTNTNAECAIECHLVSVGHRADFVLRVFPDDRDALLAQGKMHDAVARFFEAWRDPDGELQRVPFVELEHDLDGNARCPWIGPSIEPLVRHGVDAIQRNRGESARLALASMHALGERRDGWRRRVGELFSSLPPRGCINHLALGSTRAGRERAFIRLIASLRRFDVDAFLNAVGWRGSLSQLREMLNRYFRGDSRVDLDLDVDIEGCARSTAAYSDFRAPRATDSTLRDLLAATASDGLAASPSIGALSRWVEASNGSLQRVLTMKVCDDGERRFAKAYLGSLREVSS